MKQKKRRPRNAPETFGGVKALFQLYLRKGGWLTSLLGTNDGFPRLGFQTWETSEPGVGESENSPVEVHPLPHLKIEMWARQIEIPT
jgi:hypothetical protein